MVDLSDDGLSVHLVSCREVHYKIGVAEGVSID
jgi:hypothetical protein